MERGLPLPELSEAEESRPPRMPKDMFKELEELKQQGLWDGEVEHIQIKEHNLGKGAKHYFVVDPLKREVTCTSCAFRHGGILEAKHLMDYKIENGVLYFKGVAINETP
jgi:hypothetical protein